MNEYQKQHMTQMVRSMHRWLWLGYTAQFAAAFAGAACLYAAIDDWLIGQPLRSAVFTVISFWNGYNFIKSRETERDTKRLLREMRDLLRQLK